MDKLNTKLINRIMYIAFFFTIFLFLEYVGVIALLMTAIFALIPFYLGCFIAWLMRPLGKVIHKKFNIKLSIANGLAVLLNFIVVLVFIFTFLPIIISQVILLTDQFYSIWNGAISSLTGLINHFNLDFEVALEWLNKLYEKNSFTDWTSIFFDSFGKIYSAIGSTFGFLLQILFAYIIAFYFINDLPKFYIHTLKLLSGKQYEKNLMVSKEISYVLFEYIKGVSIICTFIFLFTTTTTFFLGIPLPLLLGVIAGLLNMIPYLGPFLGGVPIFLFALSVDVKTAVLAVILIVIIQSIESLFLQPTILSKKTKMKPTSILIGIMIFSSLFGLVGMIISTPVIASINVLLKNSKYDVTL
ncbi:MAG: AI-2E family transporter [Spiroplasma sp.]|nr:AI-2E family transporter [Mycoplasmatales bacterium]